jgi:hypothetical protein
MTRHYSGGRNYMRARRLSMWEQVRRLARAYYQRRRRNEPQT